MGDTIPRPSPLFCRQSAQWAPPPTLELLIEFVLQLGIPSLTRFYGLNRCTMELLNLDHQYTTIIEHCPNPVRAIVSIQADAFNCTEPFIQHDVPSAIALATISDGVLPTRDTLCDKTEAFL